MKKFNYNYIQVLWVEDDPDVIFPYTANAAKYGLQLVSFPCWDDARKALMDEFDRWSAIILDAKCKYHRDSEDNAVRFLGEALKDISVICKDRMIPWYILTGGAETEVSDSINDDRLKWDADWKEKKYYSKNTDTDILYRRIRVHANKSNRLQIQEIYRNVFDAIEECGVDDKGYNSLEDLLLPIHFPEATKDEDYNDKFVKARDVLEYIFRSMSSHGILPEWGKQVNLKWSSCLLSGMNATRSDCIVIESKKQIISPVVKRLMRELVDIIPAFCHSDNEEEGEIKKSEYLCSVDYSTALLKSITFQLCDLILWYKNYLTQHPNPNENKKEWEIKEPQYLNNSKNSSK